MENIRRKKIKKSILPWTKDDEQMLKHDERRNADTANERETPKHNGTMNAEHDGKYKSCE